MNDFQSVLRMFIESEEMPPEISAPPSGFNGSVEDASNAAEAFSAFANEHKAIYGELKQAIATAEKNLQVMQTHTASFGRSMSQRTDPATLAVPSPMKRFDRSRVNALQSDFANMRAQTPNESVFEADETAEGIKYAEFIKSTLAGLQTANAKYEQNVGQLLQRTKAKMSELAGKQTGMATSQEELQSKVKQLQGDFEQATQEVQKLVARVSGLESQGRSEDQEEIRRLGSELSNLADELAKKKSEADELSKNFGNLSARASSNIEDMLNHIDELEAYGADLHEKYTKLHKMYSSLYERAQKQTMINAPENIQHYGKFDFSEHLQRSLKNKKASGWW